MTKQEKLNLIAREIRNCQICKTGKTGKAVPGEGNPDATVMFVGEAPGRTEAKTGRPFVGRSGQLLRTLICDIGLSEEDVYITSPVKYLPIRGTPTQDDIRHGMKHLNKQISVINPPVVVLLGSVASRGVLEEEHKVMVEHGSVVNTDGRHYLITIHPSAALRFPEYRKILSHDFFILRNLYKKIHLPEKYTTFA